MFFKQLPERLRLTAGILTHMNQMPGMQKGWASYVKVYPKEG